jgi:hypothetical protein
VQRLVERARGAEVRTCYDLFAERTPGSRRPLDVQPGDQGDRAGVHLRVHGERLRAAAPAGSWAAAAHAQPATSATVLLRARGRGDWCWCIMAVARDMDTLLATAAIRKLSYQLLE